MSEVNSAVTPESVAILVRDISKRYGRMLALDEVNLVVEKNALFALLGPNGAGKTTLIHILCTILSSDSGDAFMAGANVRTNPLQARKNIGVVFQEPSLDDRLSAFENLDFHGRVYNVPKKERLEQIDRLLALVELEDWRNAIVRTFSSGMKRRLEIARALLHNPRILILDEPTVGLDAQSRAKIWAYLDLMRKQQDLTIIVTTHYIEEVENCDNLVIIDHGKILARGTPTDLKHAHGNEVIRAVPRDDNAEQQLLARYPAAQKGSDGAYMITSDGDGFVDGFLNNFGNQIKQFTFEAPSLESVFLSLTGRELRDRADDKHGKGPKTGRRGGRS